MDISRFMVYALENGATDIGLTVGSPPTLRIGGRIFSAQGEEKLSAGLIENVVRDLAVRSNAEAIYGKPAMEALAEHRELDFAFSLSGVSRFRVNIHYQRGTLACSIRVIPREIPSLLSLGLPSLVRDLAMRPRGLVLITGPTGAGKTTTLASMVDEINKHVAGKIITIEDPIEYLHNHGKCIIEQREVGVDTPSFQDGLKHLLRQDPDIIVIGELRDRESMETALTAANSGHLVLTTLHTNDAAQTINRVVSLFPFDHQPLAREQLSLVLEGIVSQNLIPADTENKLHLAYEILIPTSAVRAAIRENNIGQISSNIIQTGAKHGMISMNQSLVKLVRDGKISRTVAYGFSSSPDELLAILG